MDHGFLRYRIQDTAKRRCSTGLYSLHCTPCMYSNAACCGHDNTATPSKGGIKSSQRERSRQACGGGTVGEQGVSGDDLRSSKGGEINCLLPVRYLSLNSIIELSHQRTKSKPGMLRRNVSLVLQWRREHGKLGSVPSGSTKRRTVAKRLAVSAPGVLRRNQQEKIMGKKKNFTNLDRSTQIDNCFANVTCQTDMAAGYWFLFSHSLERRIHQAPF